MFENYRITAGSIDEDGMIIWGTDDFTVNVGGDGIYFVGVDRLDSEMSAVTCSLNNRVFGPDMDNLITFSKRGGGVQFRIQSLEDGEPNVRGSFDFIIVSSM